MHSAGDGGIKRLLGVLVGWSTVVEAAGGFLRRSFRSSRYSLQPNIIHHVNICSVKKKTYLCPSNWPCNFRYFCCKSIYAEFPAFCNSFSEAWASTCWTGKSSKDQPPPFADILPVLKRFYTHLSIIFFK